MFSPLFFLIILNYLVILTLGFYDTFLLLIIIFPWTVLLYVAFTYKGLRFSDNDIIYQYSGKLYWIGKGTFKATMIALLNLLISAILIPSNVMNILDSQFGPLTSILILFMLPMPGFLLISMERKNQEKLYELLYEHICLKNNEIPLFIVLTNELRTKYKEYTDEYFKQIDIIRRSMHEYLTKEIPRIAPFVDIESSYYLRLDQLALFMAKKTFKPENTIGEIKNID